MTDWESGALWLFETASGDRIRLPAEQCHDAVFLHDGSQVAVDRLDDIVIWDVERQ